MCPQHTSGPHRERRAIWVSLAQPSSAASDPTQLLSNLLRLPVTMPRNIQDSQPQSPNFLLALHGLGTQTCVSPIEPCSLSPPLLGLCHSFHCILTLPTTPNIHVTPPPLLQEAFSDSSPSCLPPQPTKVCTPYPVTIWLYVSQPAVSCIWGLHLVTTLFPVQPSADYWGWGLNLSWGCLAS